MATDLGGRAAWRARPKAVAGAGTRSPRAPGSWLVGACAVVAAVSIACSGGSSQSEPIELTGATADAEAPWTAVLLPPQTPTTVPYGPPGTDLPAEPGDVGIRVPGDRAGLYGGSPDRPLCNRQLLVDELEQNPGRMSAWSAVFKIDDVRSYVRTLTPVLLRADTRVTDHGFVSGRAKPFQAVLEAGTTVLIDDRGVPRVRCLDGSPLGAPVLGDETELEGAPWPGFEESRVLVVQPGSSAMPEVAVVDLMTGGLASIPVGSGPQQPTEVAAPPLPPVVNTPEPVADSPPVVQRQVVPVAPAPPTPP
ncbi:MAG: DUF6777 domain-containing protein, partial [Rhodococcus sp. (in: high G+C Gram-positive bacteria)]|uniref:DUF6777 domain-containing protein n=1 Tax=Rhodococcus sp. TaxID=1831 RepID=UPI003BAF8F10